jgi:hypothetical protein
MPDPKTIIKPGQFSMEIPGQTSAEIDTITTKGARHASNDRVTKARGGEQVRMLAKRLCDSTPDDTDRECISRPPTPHGNPAPL